MLVAWSTIKLDDFKMLSISSLGVAIRSAWGRSDR
jgi:hypothetical protein